MSVRRLDGTWAPLTVAPQSRLMLIANKGGRCAVAHLRKQPGTSIAAVNGTITELRSRGLVTAEARWSCDASARVTLTAFGWRVASAIRHGRPIPTELDEEERRADADERFRTRVREIVERSAQRSEPLEWLEGHVA